MPGLQFIEVVVAGDKQQLARCIPDFPDYAVSEDGTVWSRKIRGSHSGRLGPWRRMKLKMTRTGYLCVNLYRQHNKPERLHVHYLVLLVFCGPRPEGKLIRHLDSNKLNNHLSNLCYGTHVENAEDAIVLGTLKFGENAPMASRLTNEQVREIRRLAASGMRRREIGQRFGVSGHYVAKIMCGEIWNRVV